MNIWRLLTYGFQHVLVMYAGAIAVPLIIAGGIGLSREETSVLIQCNLLMCGVATIIQSLGIGRFAGIRLPVMMGVTFTAVPPLLLYGQTYGLPSVFGAVLLSGIVVVIIAPWFARVARFLPPVVIGSVIATIGFALMPVAFHWSMGGDVAADYGSLKYYGIAMLVILVIISLYFQKIKLLSSFSVLIGFIIGMGVSGLLGEVSLAGISDKRWVSFPPLFYFGWPTFDLVVVVNLVIVNLISMVESLGVFYTVSVATGTPIGQKEITRGYRAEGIAIFLGGLFSSFPYTTFSQNAGLITLSGVKNRYVLVTSGCILMAMGFFLPVAFFIASIPSSVIGGAAMVMFATIALAGLKVIRTTSLKPWWNILVPVSAIGLGLVVSLKPGIFGILPPGLRIFFGNSIATGSFVAVFVYFLFRLPYFFRKTDLYTTRYSLLLKTFLRSTDQKAKTVEAIRKFVIPELQNRNVFADMGCGSGEIPEAFIPLFQQSILTDLNGTNIAFLKKKLGGRAGVTILRKDLNSYIPDFSADLILFSFSLGYVGLTLPEPERLQFRIRLLTHYLQHLSPGGKIVIVDTAPSGAYRNLFDFVAVPVHEELGQLIREITATYSSHQYSYDVAVKTATMEEMVLCLRLVTYDDGTTYLNLIPWYQGFCKALPREDGMFVFRYTTVLTVIENTSPGNTLPLE